MYNCRRDFDEASSSVACRTISPLPIAGSASGSRAEDTAFGELSIARATVLGAGRYPCFSSASAHSSHKQSQAVTRLGPGCSDVRANSRVKHPIKNRPHAGPGPLRLASGSAPPHLLPTPRPRGIRSHNGPYFLCLLVCSAVFVLACLGLLACLLAYLDWIASLLACCLLASSSV